MIKGPRSHHEEYFCCCKLADHMRYAKQTLYVFKRGVYVCRNHDVRPPCTHDWSTKVARPAINRPKHFAGFVCSRGCKAGPKTTDSNHHSIQNRKVDASKRYAIRVLIREFLANSTKGSVAK